MRRRALGGREAAYLVAAFLAPGSAFGDGAPPALAGDATTALFVPIVLSSTGAHGAAYSSEVTLTNRGATTATVELRYASAFGGGEGTCTETIRSGEQKVIPDAIAYLHDRGISLPATGDRGGTVTATFAGLSSPEVAAITVRTTTATRAPQPVGAAGLAFPGSPEANAMKGKATIYGLRATPADRSNLAVYNPTTSEVTLRVMVSGDGSGISVIKADGLVVPGLGWSQINGVLDGTGFSSGWAIVERTAGYGAFEVYGVVNCNTTSDGSFIPQTAGSVSGSRITVPVLVETTSGFASELVLANRSASHVTLKLTYVESLASTLANGSAAVQLRPREQLILPDAIDYLRGMGIGIGPKGADSYAGALRITVAGAALADVFAGARTASLANSGGQFGLFTPGVYEGEEASTDAFLYGLRADADNRTNVAVVNAGLDDSGTVTLEIQAYDGDAAGLARGEPETVVLEAGAWKQFSGFLAAGGVRNGWVRVRRLSGTSPWIAYAVVNDGGAPGERTGDGAYVPMVTTPLPSPWEVSALPDAGTYDPVLAFDAAGAPAISYSVLSGEVKVARWDPIASSWRAEVVDPERFELWHPPDLSFDPGDGNPSVVYGSGSIKFAHWTGTSWKIETIEAVGQFSDAPSLAYGPDGMPAIAYRTMAWSLGLRLARWNGSSWVLETVDSDPSIGGNVSLAFDRLGNPAIAYPASPGGTPALELARWNGSKWDVEIIEALVEGYSAFPSLAFDPSGMPAIVHSTGVNGPPGVRFVRWNGVKWEGEVVASAGWKATLAYDLSGTPLVGYAEWSPYATKVARREPTGRWKVEIVERARNAAVSTSLAIDPAGRPSVAYDHVERLPGGAVRTTRFARRAVD